MDNSSSPTNGIDLNPDMMTTQTSTPTMAPGSAVNTPPEPAGIIDITPGAPAVNVTPPTQHIDSATLPEPTITHLAPVSTDSTPVPTSLPTPTVESPVTPLVSEAKPSDVIDITPGQGSPLSDGLTHLADIAPVTTPEPTAAVTPPVPVAPTPAAAPVTAPTNPLSEDPDLVKLVK